MMCVQFNTLPILLYPPRLIKLQPNFGKISWPCRTGLFNCIFPRRRRPMIWAIISIWVFAFRHNMKEVFIYHSMSIVFAFIIGEFHLIYISCAPIIYAEIGSPVGHRRRAKRAWEHYFSSIAWKDVAHLDYNLVWTLTVRFHKLRHAHKEANIERTRHRNRIQRLIGFLVYPRVNSNASDSGFFTAIVLQIFHASIIWCWRTFEFGVRVVG